MSHRSLAVLALFASLSIPALHADDEAKERAKMLKDGAKLLKSKDAEERLEGVGYFIGYATCADQQVVPALLTALKDTSPDVRSTAAQTLEKIQAKSAVPDLIALLEDPDKNVRIRAAYALGGMGKAAESALPALKKTMAAAEKSGDGMVEGSMQNGIEEITGKQTSNRYKCP
jgi:HEAT repeat protein